MTRRNRSPWGSAFGALGVLLCLAVAGCGGAASTARTGQTPIAFTSPSIAGGGGIARGGRTIPVRYTCDGTDTTPSFRWGPVPPSTASLALFLLKVGRSTPSAKGSVRVEVKLEWAIAGLSPRVHEVPAGKLPHGVLTTRKRYSICPSKGAAATYLFQLNALSHTPAVGPNFDPNQLFREVEGSTVASGTFPSSYKRV